MSYALHGLRHGVQLPEGSEHQTRARMRRRFPEAAETEPPPAVRHALDDIVALLDGGRLDLSTAALGMTGVPEFHRRVYDIARTIPPGTTGYSPQAAKTVASPQK